MSFKLIEAPNTLISINFYRQIVKTFQVNTILNRKNIIREFLSQNKWKPLSKNIL